MYESRQEASRDSRFITKRIAQVCHKERSRLCRAIRQRSGGFFPTIDLTIQFPALMRRSGIIANCSIRTNPSSLSDTRGRAGRRRKG